MKQPAVAIKLQEPATSALVERCLNGDDRAWAELVERYARLVHAVPVRHGLSPGEVDEVGQEVFLALAQHLHTIDDPERLPAWLVTTARRICWRMLQRRRHELSLEEAVVGDERSAPPEVPSPLPTPEDLLAGWARQEAIDTAMQQLEARCRELLTLIFLDPKEPSYDEIGAQLGMPKGSIGPTRNRCLQRLRALLEGSGVEDAS